MARTDSIPSVGAADYTEGRHYLAGPRAALAIAGQMVAERRRSLIGYSIGMAALMALMVAVYPSIRDTGEELDAYAESLPEAFRDAFGLAADSIASPAGYLMSQLYSNMFPIILLVLGIALAAWVIAGSEAEGTLEMLLANPVTRVWAAVGRVIGMWVLVALVTVAGTLILALTSPLVGLDEGLPWWGLWSAGVATYALVMLQASLGFAVGAASGSRGMAIAAATVFVVLGFAAQLVGSAAESLSWLRDASPWYWLLNSNPLTEAPGLLNTWIPLAIALVLTAVGIAWFDRRDLTA